MSLRQDSRIRPILDLRGIRHTWFARQVNISRQRFLKIESGLGTPPAGYYRRASELLGVPEQMLQPERGAQGHEARD